MIRNLLWIDCLGALGVGLLVVALSGWLGELYGLPRQFVLGIGAVNLVYGTYSLTLALRRRRSAFAIGFLAAANTAWGLVCLGLTYRFTGTASVFGLATLLFEGLYVGGLGIVEWRNREALLIKN